ncbi:MAG: ral secretion pathway protein [Sphingomonas bacterium]|nr:type II secretion system protein GspL [Sphingomonas bacterium]MDB5688360.1 ral secretion pathway protein [Sphingomonas bacterium]
MSARALLLFLDDAPACHWLRLEDGVITGRGDAGSPPPPPEDRPDRARVVVVVPAQDVALHWVDLPPLAPAQAMAAARLLAAEASAEPVDGLHVAVQTAGPAGEPRAIAITSAFRMAGWLGHAAALGHDPDLVLPLSLLILPPESGIRGIASGDLSVVRGPMLAFAAEPELVAVAAGDEPIETIGRDRFEEMLAEAIAARPLDLRQGAFAKRRRWRMDWALVRRLAALGAAIVAITLLIQFTLILRYSFAADRLEAEAETVARSALPRGANIANVPVQLTERLTALRGGGGVRGGARYPERRSRQPALRSRR